MIHDPNVTTYKNVKWTPLPHSQRTTQKMNQKTNYAAPALWGNSRREGIFSTRTPNNVYQRHDCRVLRHPIRSMAETTSNRIYETTPTTRESKSNTPKRSGLQKRSSRHHEEPPPQPIITTKEPAAQTQRNPVENVHDAHTLSQISEENTHDSTRPPIFHENFLISLNSIKEYVTEKDGNTYIPLHSTIVLKNRRRMLLLASGIWRINNGWPRRLRSVHQCNVMV